ncbi:hypothetical protein EJD96_02400 [Herbaspirillum seropedicae]|uniref:hypothetical protein n=1 Tax=Herbaspirillum seropedicae TaxID=964 RepID=UPI00111F3796|nr:hypothetical protein [Herbaspirillum seropedicae]QDD63074.1 hypothetical protein EJD96_02400 [Herbaspirillum seropedicae]
MPKAPRGLEHLLPDYLYARILRRAFPYHPVSQNEPLVNQLDDGEGFSPGFALALARLADHTWFELEDLPCRPVDMTRSAVS